MDLGTIKKNIVDRKYKTLQEAAEDVRLVWMNCMTYNADGSDFFILAQNLNKKWQEKYKKLLDDLRVKEQTTTTTTTTSSSSSILDAAGNNKLTLDEKRSFAKSLYKITKEDLGKILVEIEKKCPAALVKNSAEDEVELNVDKLTAPVFVELQQFVRSVQTSKPKKKSSSGGGSSKRQKS